VGNLLMRDEGVGVHVAQRLEKATLPEKVEVIDAGTLPVEALGEVEEIEKLVIVDAVKAGGPPGAVYRLPISKVSAEKPATLMAQVSLHELTLMNALDYWRAKGLEENSIVIIGVQPSVIDWGTELSEEIEAKMPVILESVLAEVR
jgi:hydrogenase maturation protease